jgi:hypothetical protein
MLIGVMGKIMNFKGRWTEVFFLALSLTRFVT